MMMPTATSTLPDLETSPSPLRRVYIETLGCQMNQNDSELMLGLLKTVDFEPTDTPEQADFVILNTCQIRENAEDKAYNYLHRLKVLKREKPWLKIAMAGCVAQQAQSTVFDRVPFVDLVLGTQNIHDLPELTRRLFPALDWQDEDPSFFLQEATAFASKKMKPGMQLLATDRQRIGSTYDYINDVAPVRQSPFSAWVTIIEGCDYFCTYCVVPYTRGRQMSRKPQSILDEVKRLVDDGVKEVTLLGQTVDAYGKDFTDPDLKHWGLQHLFEALNDLPGLTRIRFMTSHPLDLSDAIIDAIAQLERVMPYVHIPMQSGDDTVLARMKRGYTSCEYFALVDKLFDRVAGVAISGDMIVGFPGESDEQFQRSVAAIYRSNVMAVNTAAYSARAQTPAGLWETRNAHDEAVPDDIKQARLATLNHAVTDQALRWSQKFRGQTVDVLVEGPSRRNPQRWMGRTPCNKVVNFDGAYLQGTLVASDSAIGGGRPQPSIVPGHIVPVEITDVFAWSLLGRVAEV
jgi:tRNA-2-methylthio-N6-dimethylallyladenosine synthase